MTVLSVPDAKLRLNIPANITDDEIDDMIASAEAAIAQWVGPLEATDTTVRVTPQGKFLRLFPTPVLMLVSVTDCDGISVAVGDLYVDQRSGLVTYNDGSTFTARWYSVEYQAGRASCPPDLVEAIKEQVRHLYQAKRGPARRPGSPETGDVAAGASYLMPYRVRELIQPYRIQRVGG